MGHLAMYMIPNVRALPSRLWEKRGGSFKLALLVLVLALTLPLLYVCHLLTKPFRWT